MRCTALQWRRASTRTQSAAHAFDSRIAQDFAIVGAQTIADFHALRTAFARQLPLRARGSKAVMQAVSRFMGVTVTMQRKRSSTCAPISLKKPYARTSQCALIADLYWFLAAIH